MIPKGLEKLRPGREKDKAADKDVNSAQSSSAETVQSPVDASTERYDPKRLYLNNVGTFWYYDKNGDVVEFDEAADEERERQNFDPASEPAAGHPRYPRMVSQVEIPASRKGRDEEDEQEASAVGGPTDLAAAPRTTPVGGPVAAPAGPQQPQKPKEIEFDQGAKFATDAERTQALDALKRSAESLPPITGVNINQVMHDIGRITTPDGVKKMEYLLDYFQKMSLRRR